jgi:YVTN family beta-propeller protein
MTRTQPDRHAAGRLLRHLTIPASCGALALTMTAATPASAAIPATGSLTPVATIPVGQNPTGIAVDSATRTAYVTCTGPSPDLYAIDEATNTVTATIPVGTYPAAVAVNPDTDTIYTANQTAGTISVIDGATNTVTATIPLAGAYLITTDTSNNTVFAVGTAGLSIISGATSTVTKTISLSASSPAVALSVNPVTKTLYVGRTYGVDVRKASNGNLLTTIDLVTYRDPTVVSLVADSRNNMIYVAYGSQDRHRLAGISGTTDKIVKDMRLFDHPWLRETGVDLAIDQSTDRIFLTDRTTLLQITGATFRAAGVTTATVNAIPVAVDPQTSTVYVARYGSPNVYAYHSSVN